MISVAASKQATPRRADKRRFVAIGGSAFLLGGLLIEGLVAAGLTPYAAQFPTFLAGSTYTWWLNRRLTFGVKASPTLPEYLRYLSSSVGGLALSMALFSTLIWIGASALLALAGGSIAGLVFNFWGYSRFVFARPRAFATRASSSPQTGHEVQPASE